MALKKVEPGFATPWAPKKKGEKIVGIFVGSEEVVSKDNGTFTAYRLRTEEGRIMGLSGANLERTLNQIPLKTQIHVIYQGKQELANGRNMKTFDVMVNDDVMLLDPFDKLGEEGAGEIPVDGQSATA